MLTLNSAYWANHWSFFVQHLQALLRDLIRQDIVDADLQRIRSRLPSGAYFGRGADNASFFSIPINLQAVPDRTRVISERLVATHFAGPVIAISISQ